MVLANKNVFQEVTVTFEHQILNSLPQFLKNLKYCVHETDKLMSLRLARCQKECAKMRGDPGEVIVTKQFGFQNNFNNSWSRTRPFDALYDLGISAVSADYILYVPLM